MQVPNLKMERLIDLYHNLNTKENYKPFDEFLTDVARQLIEKDPDERRFPDNIREEHIEHKKIDIINELANINSLNKAVNDAALSIILSSKIREVQNIPLTTGAQISQRCHQELLLLHLKELVASIQNDPSYDVQFTAAKEHQLRQFTAMGDRTGGRSMLEQLAEEGNIQPFLSNEKLS